MKININWLEKEVIFTSTYTRKIDREFNDVLFNWVKANATSDANGVEIDLSNIQKANDYLVKSMTNLTDEEIDSLEITDYNKILEKIWEIKSPRK